jgi:hypothetical protein
VAERLDGTVGKMRELGVERNGNIRQAVWGLILLEYLATSAAAFDTETE